MGFSLVEALKSFNRHAGRSTFQISLPSHENVARVRITVDEAVLKGHVTEDLPQYLGHMTGLQPHLLNSPGVVDLITIERTQLL